MATIRPVSDLRNHFAEISRCVHESPEPVFLTKNGHGDMVVMSFDAYQKLQFDSIVYWKLREAEQQAAETGKRLSHKEVFSKLRDSLVHSPPGNTR